MRKIVLAGFLFLAFVPVLVRGQNYSDARSVGMAGAYTAIARGVWAPMWNPANLALPEHPSFSLNLVGAGLRFGNSSFSKSTYDRYNGRYLSSDDIQSILSEVPPDGLKLYFNTDISAIGISVGRFAITLSGGVASNVSLAKDYLRIALRGIEFEQSYNIGDNSGEAVGYSSVALSYAQPVPAPVFLDGLYLGASAKYLVGIGYSAIVESEGEFYNGWQSSGSGHVLARTAQGGAGLAFDFGVAALAKGWTVGVAFANLGAKIKWSVQPEEYEAQFYTIHPLTVENSADEDSVIAHSEETREIEPFSSSLPAEMRLGVARQWRSFLLSASYRQGFSQGLGVPRKPYFAFGTEWRGIGIFPLRTGIGFGGDHGVVFAAGFGVKLGFFRLDYGVSFHGAMVPAKARAVAMGLATYLQF